MSGSPPLPSWLPQIVRVSGSWDKTLPALYAVFEKDLKFARPVVNGVPVWWDRRVLPDGRYEEGFWHMISRDDPQGAGRVPDFRRAERLPWCGPVLANCGDPAVRNWDYREGKKLRRY